MRGLSSLIGNEEEKTFNPQHNADLNKRIKAVCGDIKQKVKETFIRNSKQNTKSKGLNGLVEKFGNTLIASLFEALVLKAADDIQNKPIEGELNLSSK